LSTPQCRFSGKPLKHVFVDLGSSPLANSYLTAEQLNSAERFYPLRAFVAEESFLVQLEEFETPDNIFSDYAYFSSYSTSWLKHARSYTEFMVERFGIDSRHNIIEIASNDGYLLQFFADRGIPVLGIEPAANVAKVAQTKGIRTLCEFFSSETAQRLRTAGIQADLLIGNNVLAHVPDLNGFIKGMRIILSPKGIFTMEFPHILQLILLNQFDTIYHEHFSYFSFLTVERIFRAHGLELFDVEELPTHGGSLRIYGRHDSATTPAVAERVNRLKEKETAAGLNRLETYTHFGEKAKAVKRSLLSFLIDAKTKGKSIAAYGAPAKGNTLLNYCGVRSDFIDFTVDISPHKQGLFLPGTRIPIFAPDKIRETKPDYLIILPWNLKDEIMDQMGYIRAWEGRFVVPIPEVKIYQ
jgi:SAM-dependent methyltransferase